MNAQNKPGITFEETPDSIKLSVRIEKDRTQYLLALISMLSLIAILLLIVKIILYLTDGIVSDTSMGIFLMFLISIPVLFGIYLFTRQSLYNAFLQEDVIIQDQSITVNKSGFLWFKEKKVIPFEQVEGISLNIQLSIEKNWFGNLLMNTTKIGKLLIVTRQLIKANYPICRDYSHG